MATTPLAQTELTATEARHAWLEHKRLDRVAIDARFDMAHVVGDGLVATRNVAKEFAAERFERENNFNKNNFELRRTGQLWWNPCSFTDIDERTLRNKVTGNNAKFKRATVFQGQQQLAHQVGRVTRRTVTLERVDPSSSTGKQYKNKDYVELYNDTSTMIRKYKLPDGGGDLLVDFSGVSEVSSDLVVSGPWDPTAGSCVLYHYQAQPLGDDVMLEKYLAWYKKEDGSLADPVHGS